MELVKTLVMMALCGATNRRMEIRELAMNHNVAHIKTMELVLAIDELEENGELYVSYKTKTKDGKLSDIEWRNLEQFFSDNAGRGIYDMVTYVTADKPEKDITTLKQAIEE